MILADNFSNNVLSDQDLHNLAMKTVGDSLKKDGYEFLSVNSKLKKDPQFVCLKKKKLHFFIVRAVKYPTNPKKYDVVLVDKIRKHALNYNASTYYAGVGIANSKNYENPVEFNKPYAINFEGWIKL
tara:strand:- start:1750 stop:2130 length:381 start_codon:yes stop_codon:yes gene_type:complete